MTERPAPPVEAILAEVLQPRLFRKFLEAGARGRVRHGVIYTGAFMLIFYLAPHFLVGEGEVGTYTSVQVHWLPGDEEEPVGFPSLQIEGVSYPLPDWASRYCRAIWNGRYSIPASVTCLDVILEQCV